MPNIYHCIISTEQTDLSLRTDLSPRTFSVKVKLIMPTFSEITQVAMFKICVYYVA